LLFLEIVLLQGTDFKEIVTFAVSIVITFQDICELAQEGVISVEDIESPVELFFQTINDEPSFFVTRSFT